MKSSYVTLHGILGSNHKVLCRTATIKANHLDSNSVENIFVKCLRQKSQEIV